MTTYEVFTHYYNDNIGRTVTNQTTCEWYPCLTEAKDYDSSKTYSHTYLKLGDMDKDKIDRKQEALELLYISPNTVTINDNVQTYEDLIINSSTISNPKYDMIFIYDGIGYYTNDEAGTAEEELNALYFDTMKRIKATPWFFNSKHHSLRAAQTTASKLVDLIGKEHVMIGKEVPLDQYIDIV